MYNLVERGKQKMSMTRNVEELKQSGYKIIATNQSEGTVWAKFKGSEDVVSWVLEKNGRTILGAGSTISLGMLLLYKEMYDGLMYGKHAGTNSVVVPNVLWSAKWKTDMYE